MKKITSIILAIVMLLSITSALNFNAYANVESGTCGDNLTWTLDDDGTLTISGSGRMYIEAFSGNKNIKKVIINSGVTNISFFAFSKCTELTYVTIPNSVTHIDTDAFYECTGLTSVTIPDSVTNIGENAFDGCTGLTSVTIPDSVTNIGEYAFYECTGLTSVTIPSSVTSIGASAFFRVNNVAYAGKAKGSPWGAKSLNRYVDGNLVYSDSTKTTLLGCSSIVKNLTIPNSVTSIYDSAFSGCTSLTSVTIPDSVTSIGSDAFFNCYSLTSVTIPSGVTSIGACAFFHCYSLTSITIPSGITKLKEYTFRNCRSLTCVTIPDSVTSIGSNAFYGCSGLTSVTIPDSVTSIYDSAFSGCTSLTSVTIPSSVTSIGDYAFNKVNNVAYTGTATESPWGAKSLNGYVDGNLVYSDSTKTKLLGCSSAVTSITIPNSVTSIGTSAFEDCDSLQNVYYDGTKSQWDAITIGDKNTVLTTSTVEYKSTNTDPHTYSSYITLATTSTDGKIVVKCSDCDYVKSTTKINKVSKVTLSAKKYTYNGKNKNPILTVKDSAGKTLVKGTDYTVSVPKGRKSIGKYSYKVTFKGNYSGTKNLNFTIVPKRTSLSKLTAAKAGFKATWKKQATQTTGYQVQIATNSKFTKGKKTYTVSKNKTASKAITKLKSKKKYYVRVRTYKTVGKTKYYSYWSKTKTVTTK